MKSAQWLFLVLMFFQCSVFAEAKQTSGVLDISHWHGININPDITDEGLDQIHSIGFNLVRLSMNRQPLMKKSAPYAFDEAAFARMKSIVDACRTRGLKVVIDPHTTPGTERPTTTLNKDELWTNRPDQELLVKLWDRISREYSGDSTVAGYDLLNEPSAARHINSDSKALPWNGMVAELVKQVRKNDSKTTIIVETSAEFDASGTRLNRIDSIRFLQIPADDHLIVSVHAYLPPQFTSQGVHGHATGIKYPGQIAGQSWDKAAIVANLKQVQDYASAHHVGVFIGEFSASRCGDGVSTHKYLSDMLDIFNDFKWGWAYHAYNGAPMWALVEPTNLQCKEGKAGVQSRIDLFKDFLKTKAL